MKTQKITTGQFLSFRNKLIRKLKKAESAINREFTPVANRYIKQASPVKIGKVYEPVGAKGVPRGCKRFVVFSLRPSCYSESVVIYAGGWWLNEKTGAAHKWDTRAVAGNLMNPTLFELSKNQVYTKPVKSSFIPKSKFRIK